MLLIRKHVICDNPRCGQGNMANPRGPKVEIFAGITPRADIWRILAGRGWKIRNMPEGRIIATCAGCNTPRKKGRNASKDKSNR